MTPVSRPAPLQSYPTPAPATGTVNLRRLMWLRNIAIAGQIAAILAAVGLLDIALQLPALLAVITVLAGLNLITALRLRLPRAVGDGELFLQLVIDVAALTALLYLSGGSTNPFVVLYLLPIALTAAALPGIYTWLMVAITVSAYSLLMVVHMPLPHAHAMHGSDFDLHVFGMWLGFVVSAGLIAWFVVRMSASLRDRDRALAALREQALRNERILALGTLAAGAAHELGTPLSTMAVVVGELERDSTVPGAMREPLALLRGQIARCKGILGSLSASAGAVRAESGRRLALDVYLDQVLTDWRASRPGVVVQTRWQGARPAPQIVAELTLTQALFNVLNNAADASPRSVEVDGRWDDSALALDVCDRGPGLPAATAALGTAGFSTKPPGEGMGLGLFLAQATLQRLGGAVELSNRDGGGACTRLHLPLAALRVEET